MAYSHRYGMVAFARRFLRAEEGVSAIEFAIVSVPLFLLLMAAIEFGLLFFTQIALEQMVADVVRTATIRPGSAADRAIAIRDNLKERTSTLIYGGNTIIAMDVVDAGNSAYVEPELCLIEPPTLGPTCPAGKPFEDANNNGMYDGGAVVGNAGNQNALVQYDVALPWKFFTPFIGNFFTLTQVKNAEKGKQYDAYMIRTSAVARNESFGGAP